MKYLVTRKSTQNKELIICTGCTPSNEIFEDIYECPDHITHAEDTELIEYSEHGASYKKVVLNPVKQKERLEKEQAAISANEQAIDDEKKERIAIKNAIENLHDEIDTIKNIADAKLVLKSIVTKLGKIAIRTL